MKETIVMHKFCGQFDYSEVRFYALCEYVCMYIMHVHICVPYFRVTVLCRDDNTSVTVYVRITTFSSTMRWVIATSSVACILF